jgi:hypothetical protein
MKFFIPAKIFVLNFVFSENSCTFVAGKTNIKLCLLPQKIGGKQLSPICIF